MGDNEATLLSLLRQADKTVRTAFDLADRVGTSLEGLRPSECLPSLDDQPTALELASSICAVSISLLDKLNHLRAIIGER